MRGPNIVTDTNPNNLGVTGFAIIDFSHIAIHTFTMTEEVYIDIFSCKPFDPKKIRQYLFKKLKITANNVETLEVKHPWEK